MNKNIKLWLSTIIILMAIIAVISLRLAGSLNKTLQERKQLLQLEGQIARLNASLVERDNQLKELKDVQAIKNALNNAQTAITQLNKELTFLNNENLTLREANLQLNNRLQNTTQELIRTTGDLKAAKDELLELDKNKISPLKNKIEELTQKVKTLEGEKISLNERLSSLKTARAADTADIILTEKERKIKSLEAEIVRLNSAKVLQEKNIKQQQGELARLSKELNSARQEAKEKEKAGQEKFLSEIKSLEDRLKRAKEEAQRQGAMVSLLKAEKEKLQAEVEVNKVKSLKEISETGLLYQSAKEEMVKLSDILRQKELEMDKVKKEVGGYKEQAEALENKLVELKRSLELAQKSQSKSKDLEAQLFSLRSRLNETQQLLSEKITLANSLQKNLENLNQRLLKKEEEKKALETAFAQSDAQRLAFQKELEEKKALETAFAQSDAQRLAFQKELTEEKRRFEEVNILYTNLLSQISRVSDVLARKELELEQRRKEAQVLNEEIAELKQCSVIFEKELNEAKERQKKTLDDLAMAVRLNADLQAKIIGVSQSLESPLFSVEEKEKAEELKRKVEVILSPEK